MSNHWQVKNIEPRARVIIDNDFAGDPDGLVQLAHHLLSPSVEIVGVISSQLRPGDGWDKTGDSVVEGIRLAQETMDLCGVQAELVAGAKHGLVDDSTPQPSAGLDLVLREARSASKLPLYFVCGGSLTTLASVLLTDGAALRDVTVVWIGGSEHDGAQEAPGTTPLEYNTAEDLIGARVVFAKQGFRFWQIPRNAYKQTLTSRAELEVRMNVGRLGEYLYDKVAEVHTWHKNDEHYNIGETYYMGDSVLVLVTALLSSFEPDPSSSMYDLVRKPFMIETGGYEPNPAGDLIRV
ncbi:MAG: nucleoside hydrolase, partial [Micrococcales bacterium]